MGTKNILVPRARPSVIFVDDLTNDKVPGRGRDLTVKTQFVENPAVTEYKKEVNKILKTSIERPNSK